ncbi:MAG: hypothetical protein ACI9KE_004341 [Polyangiales bacterium]
MRSLLQFLCSSLLCSVLACGSGQRRDASEPELQVSNIVEAWESGAEISQFVDPRRGLLVLRYCAGEEAPCEPSTFLHCGESLRRATAVLGEDLEMRQNYTHGAQIYECGVNECRHPPMMEYDYEGTLRFDTSVEPPVLIEVLHVEGLDSLGQVTPWAARQRASHRTQHCTEGNG